VQRGGTPAGAPPGVPTMRSLRELPACAP
jgi:hypothetical protein